MTRKDANIEQLDESTSVSEEQEGDVQYFRTQSYRKEGRLDTSYQSFLDANDMVEKSDLPKILKGKSIGCQKMCSWI